MDTKWDHRQTKEVTCARFSFQLLKNSSRIMFSKKVHVITGHFSEITDAQLTRFIDEINIQWFPFEDLDAIADI